MKNIGLRNDEINLINSIFIKYSQIKKSFIFGSRAKGNYRPNSDIDLALIVEGDSFFVEKIAVELEELPLPYKFDVQAYENIKNLELKDHIDIAYQQIVTTIQ